MDESEREVEDAILGEDEAVDEASSTSSEGQTVTETTITADEEDTGADDSSDTGVPSSSGVDEALEAWVAGGHTMDEADEGEEVLPVQFAQLEEPGASTAKPRHGRLNNVYVDIIVELGRREMSVRDLTQLKEGEVIDLSKLAGEPFDILVNDRPFAEGEIVVVTDLMAVRITHLIERPVPSEEEEE